MARRRHKSALSPHLSPHRVSPNQPSPQRHRRAPPRRHRPSPHAPATARPSRLGRLRAVPSRPPSRRHAVSLCQSPSLMCHHSASCCSRRRRAASRCRRLTSLPFRRNRSPPGRNCSPPWPAASRHVRLRTSRMMAPSPLSRRCAVSRCPVSLCARRTSSRVVRSSPVSRQMRGLPSRPRAASQCRRLVMRVGPGLRRSLLSRTCSLSRRGASRCVHRSGRRSRAGKGTSSPVARILVSRRFVVSRYVRRIGWPRTPSPVGRGNHPPRARPSPRLVVSPCVHRSGSLGLTRARLSRLSAVSRFGLLSGSPAVAGPTMGRSRLLRPCFRRLLAVSRCGLRSGRRASRCSPRPRAVSPSARRGKRRLVRRRLAVSRCVVHNVTPLPRAMTRRGHLNRTGQRAVTRCGPLAAQVRRAAHHSTRPRAVSRCVRRSVLVPRWGWSLPVRGVSPRRRVVSRCVRRSVLVPRWAWSLPVRGVSPRPLAASPCGRRTAPASRTATPSAMSPRGHRPGWVISASSLPPCARNLFGSPATRPGPRSRSASPTSRTNRVSRRSRHLHHRPTTTARAPRPAGNRARACLYSPRSCWWSRLVPVSSSSSPVCGTSWGWAVPRLRPPSPLRPLRLPSLPTSRHRAPVLRRRPSRVSTVFSPARRAIPRSAR
nr:Basic proline-rich protein precursor [Kibdelosporangium sp. MJ126-NF4]